jgi:hypothetical protein
MTHWRLLSDFRYGHTSTLLSGLQDVISRFDQYPWPEDRDPDAVLEIADQVVGLAFVAVQNYMSEVPLIVRESAESNRSIKRIDMIDLTRLCGERVPNTSLRDMEIVWHLGNYWKHADEWESPWKTQAAKNERSRKTIEALQEMAIEESTETPLLKGLELAVETPWQFAIHRLLDRAATWRERALEACGCPIP